MLLLLQMLVYMFYFVPYYVMAIYALIYPGQDWMPDWSYIHAGAAAQVSLSIVRMGSARLPCDSQS